MDDKTRKVRQRIVAAFFAVVASTVAALVYALLALLGRVPMNWPIHLGLTTGLAIINLAFVFLFFRAASSFSLRTKVSVLLWGGAVGWYWSFAPLYSFFTSTNALLLVSLSAFEFIWEVPFFSFIFIGICLLWFRPIARFAQGHAPSEQEAVRLFSTTLRFPTRVGILAFLLTFVGYFVGYLQSNYIGSQPGLEGTKTLITGLVISLFLALFYILTLDRLLGPVRGRLEERHAIPRVVQRRFSQRVLWMLIAVTTANLLLLVPLGIQGIQSFVRRTMTDDAKNVVAGFSVKAQGVHTDTDLTDLISELRGVTRGNVAVIEEHDASALKDLSAPTVQTIVTESEGVVGDYFRQEKVITFFSAPELQRKVVVTVFPHDRYRAWVALITPFAAGGLSIFIVAVMLAVFLMSEVARAVGILTQGVEQARNDTGMIPDVNTGDEFEDLAHALRFFVSETKSARRQIEAEITIAERERHTLEALVGSIGEAVLLIDREGKVRLLNPIAAKLLEVHAEEIVGTPLSTIMMLRQRGKEIKESQRPTVRSLQNGDVVVAGIQDRYDIQLVSGHRIPVGFVTSPLREQGKITGVVAVFRDLTQEGQLEAARTNFISVASHQLRTPLTSMRWFSEMLLAGQAGKLVTKQKRFVKFVYQSTLRMANLVNLLLQSARVEAGRVQVNPQPIDIKAFTEEVAESFAAMFQEKAQHIKISSNPDSLPKVPMDREILWQVVANLLSNAIRYSPKKGVVDVSITRKGESLEYTVADKGIGIPQENQSRIFERFFRAPNAIRTVPEGSGLGLALARAIVRSWGGNLWFQSQEGKGSQFSFTIPLKGMEPQEGELRLTS